MDQQYSLTFENKHWMLIPKIYVVTANIIIFYVGPDLVLLLIRQQVLIPDWLETGKKKLEKWIFCWLLSANSFTQILGNLPASRLKPCHAPQNLTEEFSGPIIIKCTHKKTYIIFKSYLFPFVCLCIKTVYLELIYDIYTESF